MQVQLSNRGATDDAMVSDLVRVAASLGGVASLTRAVYDREGKFHSSTVVRRFGSWSVACDRAGIVPGRTDLGHSDEAWMQNIYDVWIALGMQPTYNAMRDERSRFSPEGYAKRFGSWTQALRAFQEWIDARADGVSLESAVERTESRPTGPSRNRTPNIRLRWQVLQRDHFTCRACGRSPALTPGVVLHVDHVVPFSKGGTTDIENLQTLCDRCNYGKADVLQGA